MLNQSLKTLSLRRPVGEDYTLRETARYREQVEKLKKTNLADKHFPIKERAEEIMELIRTEDVIIVQAETGAGKSLDIASLARKALEIEPKIFMTQPRRDAAEGVALAMAARHNLDFGRDVSFSTSEYKGNTNETPIQIQTTGILLNRFKNDQTLASCDIVIIDEAHERDLDIDLCLGLLKRANFLRKEAGEKPIKIIICSATLPENKFEKFFNVSPEASIMIEGRNFPVTQNFASREDKYQRYFYKDKNGEQQFQEHEIPYTTMAVEKTVEIMNRQASGDILIFMPGIKQIRAVIDMLTLKNSVNKWGAEILSLHGSDSLEDRNYVLAGNKKRRIIVSTNMAETSVTVPGVKYVVDSCRKNENAYDPETRISMLTDVPASRAECKQRAGRAGRIEAGEIHHLVTEEEFTALPQYPKPEIKRSNLSGVVFKMLAMGIKDIENFSFVDQPDPKLIKAALLELNILGLIDDQRGLTVLGKKAEAIPADPRLATVVATAIDKKCLRPVLEIVSMINQPIFTKLRSNYSEADNEEEQKTNRKKTREARQQLMGDLNSEWLFYLKIFNEYKKAKRKGEKEWFCEACGFNQNSLERVMARYFQMIRNLRRAGCDTGDPGAEAREDAITLSILAGYAPDHLIKNTGNRNGVEYERVDDGDTSVRLNSATQVEDLKMGVALHFSPGKGQKTIRRGETEETIFKYAVCMHPIKPTELAEAIPHRVKPNGERFHFDEEEGRVITKRSFKFRNKKGDWISIPDEDFFETNKKTGAYLAEHISDYYFRKNEYNGKPISEWLGVSQNREKAKKINELNLRSMGLTKPIDLQKFYAEKFGKIATIEEIKKLIDARVNFNINPDNYFTAEQEQQIEIDYPKKITINGLEFSIQYQNNEGEYKAQIYISDLKSCIGIDDSQLPLIGGERKVKLGVAHGWSEYESLAQFKQQHNNNFRDRIFASWTNKPKAENLGELNLYSDLPSLQDYQSLEYGVDLFNQPLIAYPAISIDDQELRLDYYPSQEEANAVNAKTEQVKMEKENAERDKLKIKEMQAKFISELPKLENEIRSYQKEEDADWSNEAYELLIKLKNILFDGYTQYPRADVNMEEAEETYNSLGETLEKKKEEWRQNNQKKSKRIFALSQKYEKTIEKVLASESRYKSEWLYSLQKVRKLIDSDLPEDQDIEQAEENLWNIRQSASSGDVAYSDDTPLNETSDNYSSALAEAFQKKKERKEKPKKTKHSSYNPLAYLNKITVVSKPAPAKSPKPSIDSDLPENPQPIISKPVITEQEKEPTDYFTPIEEMHETTMSDEWEANGIELDEINEQYPEIDELENITKILAEKNTEFEKINTKISRLEEKIKKADKTDKKEIQADIDRQKQQKSNIDSEKGELRKQIKELTTKVNRIDKAIKKRKNALEKRQAILTEALGL